MNTQPWQAYVLLVGGVAYLFYRHKLRAGHEKTLPPPTSAERRLRAWRLAGGILVALALLLRSESVVRAISYSISGGVASIVFQLLQYGQPVGIILGLWLYFRADRQLRARERMRSAGSLQ